VRNLLARLGRGAEALSGAGTVFADAARAAAILSPNPGWQRVRVPGLKWTSGSGARGLALWEQGGPWENALDLAGGLGERLAQNFRVFDFWDEGSGLATSAKTLNTLAPAYTSQPSAVYYRLRRYLDAMVEFERDKKLGAKFKSADIKRLQMFLAVPVGTTDRQIVQILRAKDYAEALGIEFVVKMAE